ncbi:AsnC family protein [Kiloniella laminariae]|uniref:siroheme decarboxylase n=1 Tax=Kiloniella laminariae TaxID=454162 RepID=A0ABT4LGS7_9PROT|nr:AsnC family protein [Kiloniella laminariae]MCZ4280312.1 AsnC family protein [Kiloniella laminariae]
MMLDKFEKNLIARLKTGLAHTARPYHELAGGLGCDEEKVMATIKKLKDEGVISRFGAILHHRELGYKANAMCVFDLPDAHVGDFGRQITAYPFVTLCYQRKRALPRWPYNLYCMIHGKDRDIVLRQYTQLVSDLSLEEVAKQILFSDRRFKQTAGNYGTAGGSDD